MLQTGILRKLRIYKKVNWYKTIYFNFKMFPFVEAIKFPVFFYGRYKFSALIGTIKINGPIKTAMIGFGQPYELQKQGMGISELNLKGQLVFSGHVQFGKDCFISISKGAYCEMGHMASLGSKSTLICTNKISFGTWTRIGADSKVIDTNYHQMYDAVTNERFPVHGPIKLGNYNYIGSDVSIKQHTVTPDFCTIASYSLCNNDYSTYGKNILIGGIPAKLLKNNISRDWEGERSRLEKTLIVEL